MTLVCAFSLQAGSPDAVKAQMSYSARMGNPAKALELYNQYALMQGAHDFDALKTICIGMLQNGVREAKESSDLMSVYGAGLSQSEETMSVLEVGLNSKNPQAQAISLHFLSRLANDKADQLILGLLKNPNPILQLEAVFALAQKKHPKAGALAESLMSKYPAMIKPIFPAIFSELSSRRSDALLRQLLHDADERVRLEAIGALVKNGRDDFLPQLRRLASHTQVQQQEALCFAFERFHDETMCPRLEEFVRSKSPYVAVAAAHTLYILGKKEYREVLSIAAGEGFGFAVFAMQDVDEAAPELIALTRSSDPDIRLNAAIALAKAKLPGARQALEEVLFQGNNRIITQARSPGKALTCFKWAPAHAAVGRHGPAIAAVSQNIRRALITEAINLPEKDFLYLAEKALSTNQLDIVPLVVKLLENHGSAEAEEILITHAQRIGAPYVRSFCNLALFRMKGKEIYAVKVREWVSQYGMNSIAELKPYLPFELRLETEYFDLSPEEQTSLFLESVEALAVSKKTEDIQTLLDVMQTGNPINRYALAGVMLRALQ